MLNKAELMFNLENLIGQQSYNCNSIAIMDPSCIQAHFVEINPAVKRGYVHMLVFVNFVSLSPTVTLKFG